jgi:hypothetical protein
MNLPWTKEELRAELYKLTDVPIDQLHGVVDEESKGVLAEAQAMALRTMHRLDSGNFDLVTATYTYILAATTVAAIRKDHDALPELQRRINEWR